MSTVLVTGGSGFIGSWCVINALQQGHTVRTTVRDLKREATVRASIAKVIDPKDKLSFFAADLMSDTGWDAATQGCEYVLHAQRASADDEVALASSDTAQSTATLNRLMESVIMQAPEQYLWGYNRYKGPRAEALTSADVRGEARS